MNIRLGTIVDVKFNDLWAFDLKSEEWQEFQMGQGDVIPEVSLFFKG